MQRGHASRLAVFVFGREASGQRANTGRLRHARYLRGERDADSDLPAGGDAGVQIEHARGTARALAAMEREMAAGIILKPAMILPQRRRERRG